MESDTLMTLAEIMEKRGSNFYVLDTQTDEIVEATFLFSNMFGLKNEDGYSYFALGNKRRYKYITSLDKGEQGMISPEDQKKARELERQKTNQRITRELKMRKSWDEKFSKVIEKRTTKKKHQFTVIEGGKK